MALAIKRLHLFGGDRPWNSSEWTEQSDSVRGGSSTSTLLIPLGGVYAVFSGNLDTKTLGGAGFASQRTTEDRVWDISEYQGIELFIKPRGCEETSSIDSTPLTNKTYSFNIKDVLPETYTGNGTVRENSSLEYQANFVPSGEIPPEGERIVLPFGSFEATYRGRPKEGAKLNLSSVRQFSLMVRSFFGSQEGEFRLVIVSISAVKALPVTCPLSRVTLGQAPIGPKDPCGEFDDDNHSVASKGSLRGRGR